MPRFEEEIQKAIATGIFPGASLLVGRKGEILYRNFFGFASLLPEKESLTAQTLFDIASLTKAVSTTTLAMVALQEKRLSLDIAVSKKVPELAGGEKSRITVRHLLKHTSGLPDWRPYFQEIEREKPSLLGTREAATVYLEKISEEPLVVPPAYQRIYSDVGFILLGISLERIFGIPLDRLFQEKVAEPLGLTATCFLPSDRPSPDRHRFAATEDSPWRKRILRGEVHDDNAFAMGGVAGHAGLFSAVDDLHTFLTEIEKGFRGQSALFSQDAVLEFVGPKVKFKLGWDTPTLPESQAGSHFSRNTIGHLGYTGCSFWADLDEDMHVILLTNRVHPSSKNEEIRKLRPGLHDMIYEELISASIASQK